MANSGGDGSSSLWSQKLPSDDDDEALQTLCREKDRVISTLERVIAEQKRQRAHEHQEVESKANKIRDWVQNKLKELEEQNTHLQQENQRCNIQLEQLRTRLLQLSAMQSDSSSYSVFRDSRDEEEAIERLSRQVEAVAMELEANSMGEPTTFHNPLYMDAPSQPPGIALQRKQFRRVITSTASSECSETDLRPFATEPRRSSNSSANNTGGGRTVGGSLDRHGGLLVNNVAVECRKLNANEIRFASERRCRVVMGHTAPSGQGHRRRGSESHIPTDEVAPALPVHRCPSWESRIYELANSGLNKSMHSISSGISCGGPGPMSCSSGASTLETRVAKVADGAPLFTALHGHASQIRGAPFGDDSCTDSEEEDRTLSNIVRDPSLALMNASQHTDLGGGVMGTSLEIDEEGDYAVPPDATGDGGSQMTSVPSGIVLSPTAANAPRSSRPPTGSQLVLSSPIKTPTSQIGGTLYPLVNTTVTTPKSTPGTARRAEKQRHDRVGYLTKLSGTIKPTWHRRWFQLHDGQLTYYKTAPPSMDGSFGSGGAVVGTPSRRRRWVGSTPPTTITLDDGTRLTRLSDNSFEIATTARSYYLMADSTLDADNWMKALQGVLRGVSVRRLLSGDAKPTLEGWVKKVKHGRARRCWAVLCQRTLLYFRSPSDAWPIGQLNLRDVRVDEVSRRRSSESSSSDEDSHSECAAAPGDKGGDDDTSPVFTLRLQPIQPKSASPTYLLFTTRQDMETWLYQLTVAASGQRSANCPTDNLGTEYERTLEKLMANCQSEDDPQRSSFWKHPLLLYSKTSLDQPLTSLVSRDLQAEALKMFKSIQLFTSVVMDSGGASSGAVDYHVALAQNILDVCVQQLPLRDELYAQLVKQTSPPHHKAGVQELLLCATQSLFSCDGGQAVPTSTPFVPTGTKTVPTLDSPSSVGQGCGSLVVAGRRIAAHVFLQAWQLLALATSLFLPKRPSILWLLKQHMQRYSDSNCEPGRYAIYCERSLERCRIMGERQWRPSRMETLSLLLKNPYYHSQPHSIPVHFLNDTYQVVGFDGSSTVWEFQRTLNAEVGIRDVAGFALYSDQPLDSDRLQYLAPNDKLCDIISQWESILREKQLGKFEVTRVIRLTCKSRLCFSEYQRGETERERLLWVYDIHQRIMRGSFPLTMQLAIELAALMLQIDVGDHDIQAARWKVDAESQRMRLMRKFFPEQFLTEDDNGADRETCSQLLAKWSALRGRSTQDCVRIFLNCVRQWPFCGATVYVAKWKQQPQGQSPGGAPNESSRARRTTVRLAIGEECVGILDYTSMQALCRVSYASLLTFGACGRDLLLVVQQTASQPAKRLLFGMQRHQIIEATHLIADYMNGPRKTAIASHGGASSRVGSGRTSPALPRTPAADAITPNNDDDDDYEDDDVADDGT